MIQLSYEITTRGNPEGGKKKKKKSCMAILNLVTRQRSFSLWTSRGAKGVVDQKYQIQSLENDTLLMFSPVLKLPIYVNNCE